MTSMNAAQQELIQARERIERLRAMPRVHAPPGSFYVFFAVDGMTDGVAECRRFVSEARVGLAPGAAFGQAGEGFIRLCFANSLETLHEAFDRLARVLA